MLALAGAKLLVSYLTFWNQTLSVTAITVVNIFYAAASFFQKQISVHSTEVENFSRHSVYGKRYILTYGKYSNIEQGAPDVKVARKVSVGCWKNIVYENVIILLQYWLKYLLISIYTTSLIDCSTWCSTLCPYLSINRGFIFWTKQKCINIEKQI